MRRLCLALGLLLAAVPIRAQANATLKRAVDAGDGLEYATALRLARAAIGERLTPPDLKIAYRLLGTTYAAMDSSAEAQDAFSQLILLDPEFDFDAARVSPKITGQYALALAEVLVVRHLAVDSAAFIAGRAETFLRFTLTQRARVVARIEGPAGAVTIDSSVVDPGTVRMGWNGLLAGGGAPAAGAYRFVVEARSTGTQFSAQLSLTIATGAVDTVAHLARLEGYDPLPETVLPPRSFRPLGVAALLTGLVAGGSLALENSDLGGGVSRRALTIGGLTAMLAGLFASFDRPVAVPSEANIRYNQLIRDLLTRQNEQIAQGNRLRQQQVELTITSAPPPVSAP
ncbi:MAG: hypothetical protein ACHQXA_04610 [Gemmatimonadales bacterium]